MQKAKIPKKVSLNNNKIKESGFNHAILNLDKSKSTADIGHVYEL